MSPKARLLFVVGLLSAMLGCLWLLQGLGLLHIRPILCFADCEPIETRSLLWALLGFALAALGSLVAAHSLRHRIASSSNSRPGRW